MDYVRIIAEDIFVVIYGSRMARKAIKDKIASHSDNIITHLIWAYIYQESNDYNHWKQEIANPHMRISRIKWKSNNRYLPFTDYFEQWFIVPLTDKSKYKSRYQIDYDIIEKGYIPEAYYHNKTYGEPTTNPKKIGKYLEEFFKTISKWLSGNTISRQKIYDLIDDLIQKYNK